MTARLALRRLVIVAACIVAIGGVVGVVRIAAVLRADAAPLVVAPISAERIGADIQTEASRASDLAQALTGLESQAADIDGALAAAGDQMTADAATAAQLRADIATAKERLASLQAQLAAAQTRLARLVAAANVAPAAAPIGAGGQEGGEHEADDD